VILTFPPGFGPQPTETSMPIPTLNMTTKENSLEVRLIRRDESMLYI